MGVNENRQTGLDEAVQVGSTAAKVVEGAAKAGKITAAAANGAALGGPYGAAASIAIAAAKHGKKILLALLAILAIPLLFLVMLPTLIFGGTAQTTGDTTILNDQAAITENKVFAGLVEGRVSKQLKDICLLDQVYVRAEDGKQTVAKYLESVDKALSIAKVVRFEVGEGIEKKEENFAEEVATQMAGN